MDRTPVNLWNRVEIWLVAPAEIKDPDLLRAYDSLLTAEERDKQQRFVFEKHRHDCLVARALVRCCLSRYADVEPADWRFEVNSYGRPEVQPGFVEWPLRFNLSHTEGLIACAVTAACDVGVDVEYPARMKDPLDIADRFFSAFEVEALHRLAHTAQRERFFRYWTLKEAYIKARGVGLSLPLRQFSFNLDQGSRIAISFDPQLQDDPSSWQFISVEPTVDHILAAAVKRGAGVPDYAAAIEWTVPLTTS